MGEDRSQIQIVAIRGSAREGNYTAMALDVVVDELEKDEHVAVWVIDPAEMGLPLPGTGGNEATEELQKLVEGATAVILSTPEYHGSYSSLIKLTIEHLGFPSALGGKPIALLGVAAGQIGAIKALEHLRSVASHVGAIVLPGPVSIAGVQSVFAKDGTCKDPAVEKRLRGLATHLLDYIHDNICPRVALEAMVREEAAG